MKNRVATALALFLAASCASGEKSAPPSPAVAAAGLPDSEIFLAPLDFSGAAPIAGEFENATKHVGYDNQPAFLAGEAAFYYVAAGDNGKTDIRLFDIGRGASQPVFTSPDRSEYSPRAAPGGGISYIQEDPAGEVTRVHRRSLEAADNGAPVADFAPLGYYAWLDGGKALAVYYRSEPGSLYRVDIASGATTVVREGIGRTLQSNPAGDTLWYSEIAGREPETLAAAKYDSATRSSEPLFALPACATDFFVVLDKDGRAHGFLSASGQSIYWRAADTPDWTMVASLAANGVAALSRIAVSDDRKWIAVVGELPGP